MPTRYRVNKYSVISSHTYFGEWKVFISFKECEKELENIRDREPVRDITIEYSWKEK